MRFLLGLGILCHSGLLFASVPPNDEKLIESLIEQGVICQGLSYEQQQKALSIYLQKRVGKRKEPTESRPNTEPETSSPEPVGELKPNCINPDSQ
ncbi:hypothetical protein [Vibrio metoecus]|uniref:hypothetical protein n=1 Tax=Vibrio metoecus TaxID=1481663 RepID=UPI0006D80F37|nr:hypothetical protein [Vibrio metoecus]KQA20388.1 hypothetical protein AAY52_01610 [Vibrio metoecus]